MRTRNAILLTAAFVATALGAFFAGSLISNPTVEPRTTPNALCFRDTNPEQFTPQHVETKLIACQVVGMTKDAAIEYIEEQSITVRIAMEDGEYFALTEDYTDSRINLEIIRGLVVGATAW